MTRKAKRSGDGGDRASLTQDVAAFASQLGLRPTGADAGFDDSDFAPSKASLRIGAPDAEAEAPVRAAKKSTNKFKPEQGPVVARDEQEDGKAELAASITERKWNAGVGERPGTLSIVILAIPCDR